VVDVHSPLCGQSLNQLQLTARFELIVVAIERAGHLLVPPDPNRPIFPTDKLLLYGKESAYDQFRAEFSSQVDNLTTGEIADLSTLAIPTPQALVGKSIQSAAFRRNFQCLILSIQRGTSTIRQPRGDFILEAEDRMLVVGPRESVQRLMREYG
jgi:CPA2 family monovalent cation:H+ antiporter-2